MYNVPNEGKRVDESQRSGSVLPATGVVLGTYTPYNKCTKHQQTPAWFSILCLLHQTTIY